MVRTFTFSDTEVRGRVKVHLCTGQKFLKFIGSYLSSDLYSQFSGESKERRDPWVKDSKLVHPTRVRVPVRVSYGTIQVGSGVIRLQWRSRGGWYWY